MGHIIPAGTGFDHHRKVRLKPLVELQAGNPRPRSPPPPRSLPPPKTRSWADPARSD